MQIRKQARPMTMKDEIRKHPKVKEYETRLIEHCIIMKEKNAPPFARMHPNFSRKLALEMGMCTAMHYAHTRALADYLFNTGLCEKLNRIFTERYGELKKPAQYFYRVKGAARKRAVDFALKSLNDKNWWTLEQPTLPEKKENNDNR